MELLPIIIFFCFGLVFGSFYNVVGLRVPQNNLFKSDRSYCPNCKKTLEWYELVPVISFLIQLGKCRGCKQRIRLLYPLIEFLTAVCFALSYWLFGVGADLIIALIVVSLAVIVIVSDSVYMLIPNKVLLFFFPLLILTRVVVPLSPWWSAPLGSIVGFGLIFIIIVVSKGGMGAGDLKYFAVLGYAFGYQAILLILMLASVYGATITGVLLIARKVDRKSKVPFGPYISLAVLTVLFFGQALIDWYIGLFN
ncbi:leader peptidase (prepilin peptidase) / N-methyltransferase [Amphibacillus marinus]|uniref:Leader peptidase (Prepilin peptidase) / N-methyltransferase n=1 Tax=Amphibacillus marinus TaxID=872970 RepID=A0A1H8TRZ2_9BACI|nr:A24 family peptidase [Amphibacillus marinus]SEO93667.1 leader peptidase (prepilin peptidase) / N-methyltransferase [Amphibacillus marinus]